MISSQTNKKHGMMLVFSLVFSFCVTTFATTYAAAETKSNQEIAIKQDVSFKFDNQKFFNKQMSYPRVSTAYNETKEDIANILSDKGLGLDNFHMLLLAYKYPGNIELWVKSKAEQQYKPLVSYNICYFSGLLGPKRQEGDEQTPEGLYYIDQFNPRSSYHLSMRVSYPNKSDRIKTTNKSAPGGAIMIHGDCRSIGCMAMTDELIQEIYTYAVLATSNGQEKIPVYIFPFEMNEELMNRALNQSRYVQYKEFWDNLKEGYDIFIQTHEELEYDIDKEGNYVYLKKAPAQEENSVMKIVSESTYRFGVQ